jgi:hypothetical protein
MTPFIIATLMTTIAMRITVISVIGRDPYFAHTRLVVPRNVATSGAIVTICDYPTAIDPNIIRDVAPVTTAMTDMDRGMVVAVSIKCIRNDEAADYTTEDREPFVYRIGGLGCNDHESGGEK